MCGGLLGAALAHADSGGDRDPQQRRDDGRNPPAHQQNAPRQAEPRQAEARQADPHQAEQPRQVDPRSYEARAEEQRRAMQEAGRNAEMSRRVGRLTPDERRDLRRQINEVGQDIYSTPPRR